MNTSCVRVVCLMFALSLGAARATSIEGVDVPAQVTVAGKTLVLNGAGLRTFKLGPIPFKVYVASFYAPEKLTSADAVGSSAGPLQFNFTFLRNVDQGQVTEAWNSQFKESASYSYDGYAADLAKFVGCFGPLESGGVETVNLVGDDTQVYDGKALKGTIKGKNFQKVFLSLWFGEKPVTAKLKAELLGGG